MKKQLTILLLFVFHFTFICGQTWMKTTTPCNNELLKKTPGEWLGVGKSYSAKLAKQELQQIEKRLNTIHEWVRAIYPSPMAFDAGTGYFTSNINFAYEHKIEKLPDGRIRTSPINGTPLFNYRYSTMFCAYHCGRTANEIMRGRGCEVGSVVAVIFNSLTPLFFEKSNDDFYTEFMRIDERPIQMFSVRQDKWKGYDVYSPQSGSSDRFILLYREGILPYIPVTRKQYLERSIQCLENFFDKNIKTYEEFGALMDKKIKDENIKKQQKQKDEVLKYYRHEMESTTNAGLLNSPAIIPVTFAYPDPNVPVFTTSAAGGYMLVTENPAYIKKELPKYIPQLIILRMWNRGDGPDPALNPYHLYYNDFPIEKLQAMIDK